MKVEIIKAEDYGLETKKADELTVGLGVVRAERELLIEEFERASKLEITKENLPKFKELRLRIVKNRTQGINKWHKTNKEFFLTGGKFVDAIKNKESAINEQMEEKLMSAEKHFENLEKERIAKLQEKRVLLLSEFVEDANERDLAKFADDEFDALLAMKKKEHKDKIAAEKKAEEERFAKEKAEEAERLRIKKENEKLKAEAERAAKEKAKEEAERVKIEADRLAKEKAEQAVREEKERIEREKYEAELKAEKERAAKIEAELKAKKEAEEKAKKEEAEKLQSELNKGDADKIKDLVLDLKNLKTKYSFMSDKNIKTYKDVSLLIDKIIDHITD